MFLVIVVYIDWSEVEDLGFEEFFTSVLNRTEEFFARIVRSDDEEHSHVDFLEKNDNTTCPTIISGYKWSLICKCLKATCNFCG